MQSDKLAWMKTEIEFGVSTWKSQELKKNSEVIIQESAIFEWEIGTRHSQRINTEFWLLTSEFYSDKK